MDNAVCEDWESWEFEYNHHYKAIEPPEFDNWWNLMEANKVVPYEKLLKSYWDAKTYALIGWIAREQGWYEK